MGQSLSQIYVHLVFSTKNRTAYLRPEIREALGGYMAGILKTLDGHLLSFGAVSDHVHLLYSHPKGLSPVEVIGKIKANSSRWVKRRGETYAGFQWQAGYGAFSVSASRVGAVRQYIHNQEEHHRVQSFQDELRRFLQEYGIDFDERYVWE